MTSKDKGIWPYHEDPHGDWVACSNNPCKLHSGGDIMATSPEDAFAKADKLAHSEGGGGYAGSADSQDNVVGNDSEEIHKEEVHRIAEARKKRNAEIRERMKSFYKEPVTDPPQEFKDTWGSTKYLEIGGKYFETADLPRTKVAALIRHDISLLQESGGIPDGWKVKVITVKNPNGDRYDFHINVSRPAGTMPAHRHVRPTDIYDPNHEGVGHPYYQMMMKDNSRTSDYTYEQAAKYCHDNLRNRMTTTAENDDTLKRLRDIAKQYAITGMPGKVPPPNIPGHPRPILTETSYNSGRYRLTVNEHSTLVMYDVKDDDPRNRIKMPQE